MVETVPLVYRGERVDTILPVSSSILVFLNFFTMNWCFLVSQKVYCESESRGGGFFLAFCGVKFFVFCNKKQVSACCLERGF